MERKWLKIQEVALYLSLHPKSVYRLIDRGEIPCSRIGRNIRIDKNKLEKLLESQKDL